MKKHIKLLLVLLCISSLCGCAIKLPSITSKKHNSQEKTTTENKKTNTIQHSNSYIDKSYQCKFTGEFVDKKTYDKIPIMAIVENSKLSRPQSGISCADIVYETLAEGGISRFIALFQKNDCKKIGPIRSARPYFLDIAKEYNLPFAHCGGSEEALNRIKYEHTMSINEIAYSAFFHRDNTRKAPHNLYTSTEEIRRFAKEKNYVKKPNVKLNFDKNYWESNSLKKASKITLNLNKYYTTSYVFSQGKYIKSMDGLLTKDPLNNQPICINNIIVQITNIHATNDELHHVKIDLVGKGIGYFISNGKYKKIMWSKKVKILKL
ncbi:DUF3048 domain-containing protein [Haloimpatiens sp. FM7330]|uniref:DUF3048 domain-containing protein n=1 Tax=Haloimpatiens sp. FM7330 TaxID=3298610 RepID=UPI00362A57EC